MAAVVHYVRPMLATLVGQPFDRAGWIFEPKWDGYRAIAEVRKEKVRLYSRNQKSMAESYPAIVDALREMRHDAILDGEIVVLDAHGRSSFQLLQNYRRTGQGALAYYVFDLLRLDGQDLRKRPLFERKAHLSELLGELETDGPIRYSDHVEDKGKALFREATRAHLEGIVAKRGESLYVEGSRTSDWLKIKTRQRQEAVIGGFTDPRGSRKHLGALVLGVYEGDDLVYIGHSGGGFNTRSLAEVRGLLDPLIREECSFVKRPSTNMPVHWVEPRLVCEVEFQEWTEDGILRQPIFLGLREDKPARSVRRERTQPLGKVLEPAKTHSKRRSSANSFQLTRESTSRRRSR